MPHDIKDLSLADAGLARKVAAIERALRRARPDPGQPLRMLSELGGIDLAVLAGVFIGCAALRLPAVVDGLLRRWGMDPEGRYLGITVRDLDASTAELYSLPLGAYVLSVETGSCANEAGLVSGDIITGIGDITVESYTDLVAALKNFSAGDTVTLTVYRGGQTVELTVTLDEKVQTQQPTVEQRQQFTEPYYGQDPFSYFFGN